MRDSTSHWQKILADGFSSVKDILSHLHLPLELGSELAEQSFKTKVPRSFVAKITPGDPRDPLLLQILASPHELDNAVEYQTDPLQENTVNPIPGLIQKYANRVLLTLTGVCAINCRFCFRRHFPYKDNNPGQDGWQKAIAYIQDRPNIQEVILSGGDPLLATDQVLARLLNTLSTITHLKTVRIHTRVPIVLPERIQDSLFSAFPTKRFQVVLVLHCNHPQELDPSIYSACQRMRDAGWVLFNQSVLLKGINNSADILATLSQRLFDFHVLPYYLHLLDPVQGAEQFDLSINEALNIYEDLQRHLPGYLVPKLVKEQAGVPYKTIVTQRNNHAT